MPTLTMDELQVLVDEGRLGAITLDTSVYQQLGFNFAGSVLAALAQFPEHGIRHLVTDVVAGEVRAHMVQKEEEAVASLRRALKDYGRERRGYQEEVERAAGVLGLDEDVEVAVYGRWLDFLSDTRLELVQGDVVDGGTLVDMYFSHAAPFEAKEKKKHEFPDAIALMALEAEGRSMGKPILAVTKDAGWATFAASAEWLVAITDLLPAVNLLHKSDEAAAERAKALLADPDAAIREDISDALSRFVDDLYPSIEAESFMEVSGELEQVTMAEVRPFDPAAATVLASDPETVTLAFEAMVEVDVEAHFSFYVHDSVDDDDLGMGGTSVSKRVPVATRVTLVVLRAGSAEDGAVSVEVDRVRLPTVDFGLVEPDGWRD